MSEVYFAYESGENPNGDHFKNKNKIFPRGLWRFVTFVGVAEGMTPSHVSE